MHDHANVARLQAELRQRAGEYDLGMLEKNRALLKI